MVRKDDIVDIIEARLGWAIAEQAKDLLEHNIDFFVENEDRQLNPNAIFYIIAFAEKRGFKRLASKAKQYLKKVEGMSEEDIEREVRARRHNV
jgi:hypothetical protein